MQSTPNSPFRGVFLLYFLRVFLLCFKKKVYEYLCKGGVTVNEKKYDEDGYLIISETDSCPLWEKDTIPSAFVCTKDCFYCAFSNFRQDEYMQSLGDKEKGEKLYSICHNEFNRK